MGLFKKNVTVTKSLAMSGKETGAIVGVKGAMLGRIHRMEPGEEAIIGSDPNIANVLIDNNGIDKNTINGKLCSIRYIQESKEYIVCNLSGGYVMVDGDELEQDKEYTFEPGTKISIGSLANEIRLG